jgi:hypothetical protein
MLLFNLMPKVKRARDFYLYDDHGIRILDLYLDNGRAIAGHRPNGLSLSLKNTISRGLYAPYPSIFTDRLQKMILKEFPQFSKVGLYRNSCSLDDSFSDPVFDKDNSEYVIWRPYLEISRQCKKMIVHFPFPGSEAIVLLSNEDKSLPESDILPPFILAGLIRSYYDLKKSLESFDSSSWSLLDETGHWDRKGPYLIPRCSEKEYEKLFRLYLRNQVLISPDYSKPSICAVDLQTGSLKKLLRCIKEG